MDGEDPGRGSGRRRHVDGRGRLPPPRRLSLQVVKPRAPAPPAAVAEVVTPLPSPDAFADRHIGPRSEDLPAMLTPLGYDDLDELIEAVVPESIRLERPLELPPPATEAEAHAELRELAGANRVFKSYIGMGYHDTFTPPVILRNIIENPGWYTAYTPYQAEISQGRMEALLAFQTMVADLTGLPVANASLLDEGTAAAEAMAMTIAVTGRRERPSYLVDQGCHPQTIAVVGTRAEARGIRVQVVDAATAPFGPDVAGVLIQYPTTEGAVPDWRGVCERVHEAGGLVTAATDLLALTLLEPPGSWGADIAIGNSQRFGVPLGFGGPHAAFFAAREEHVRAMPGRIIGVTRDKAGREAYRMALQTREQHIRKERATSNVCTAQVLLAVVAAMYAVWHGPEGLERIARRVHGLTTRLAEGLGHHGHELVHDTWFDTLTVLVDAAAPIHEAARERGINLRPLGESRIGVALDETTREEDVEELIEVFGGFMADGDPGARPASEPIPPALRRRSPFLTHDVFRRHRSESEMLRYLKRLENRDFSLAHGMIPLGSCTMKLNATTEMIPITWEGFSRIHPFAPSEQAEGY
ncbi:MAG TPA: glycine dehydrogenase (aminomethyl-transferring), partial [Gemmatimonadota bacterium]|nr:glycine dehydrogenase (aminomethyl-transferring) [Gemmatimonadota bacterium]